MFISKLIGKVQQTNQNTNLTQTGLKLKPFVDLFLDTAGWYAQGHYDRKQFLAAVIKKEKFPYSAYRPQQVQLAWAKFDDHNFEIVDRSTKDAQPITYLEDLGLLEDH